MDDPKRTTPRPLTPAERAELPCRWLAADPVASAERGVGEAVWWCWFFAVALVAAAAVLLS